MRNLSSAFGAAVLASACAAAFSAPAAAAYPEKPVKVVIAFSPGGTTDILARSTTEVMAKKLGQPFIIENRPGAGGNIGTEYVVKSAPDGYTLIVDSVGPIAVNPSLNKLPYDPLVDLIPITQIATVPNVLVVPATSPVKDFKGFVEYVKSKKDVNYCSTGVGTAAHLSSFMLMDLLKVNATHIPYKGADALTDLIAGRVDFMLATIPSVMSNIKAGKLRALAVSTVQRSTGLPHLPTIAESGFPGFDAGSWFGFYAPKGTPAEVIDTIQREVNAALPGIKDKLIAEGAEPVGGTPAEYYKFVKAETEKWAALVKKFNASANK